MGTRSNAERDALTVETGYAVVSGVLAAGLVLGAIAGPVLLFELPHAVDTVLGYTGAGIATLTFVARVTHVLWRFPQRTGQPSQPGRTSPDS